MWNWIRDNIGTFCIVLGIVVIATILAVVITAKAVGGSPATSTAAPAAPSAPADTVTPTETITTPGPGVTLPGTPVPSGKPPALHTGQTYKIIGPVTIRGLHITDPEKLNEFLRKKSRDGAGPQVYSHLITNGRVPPEFEVLAGEILRPGITPRSNRQLSVCFNFEVEGVTREAEALTGYDACATLAYYIEILDSPKVRFDIGNTDSNGSIMVGSQVYPRRIARCIGNGVVGTPHNFIPVSEDQQEHNARVGTLSIPRL